jgi:molybdopterin/thiamine biosynthesis adenylyltransferase
MEKIPQNIITEFKKIKVESKKLKKVIPLISVREIKEMAQKYHLSQLEIEISALQKNILPARYERNYGIISFSEQIQLLRSTIAVVGCGGLGGNIIELLARLGIGNLVIVDGDIFHESNLNRQLLSTEKNIGKGKAETAVKRIKHINSSIHTRSYSQFIDSTNFREIINGVDLAVDALDNISSRIILEKACQMLNIPLIHGAIHGFNGQVSTIFPQDKGFEAIYGSVQRYDKKKEMPKVSAPSVTPALVATFQVQEIIKVLLNRGKPLRNKLLLINLEESEMNLLEIE